MKRNPLFVFIILVMLLVTACGQKQSVNSGSSTDELGDSPSGEHSTIQEMITPTEDLYAQDLQNMPRVMSLEVSPGVVGYGEELKIQSRESMDGLLEIHGPQGFQTSTGLVAGDASMTFNHNAPAGVYWLTLATTEGDFASGIFRLADEPGIWLTVDRTNIQPGDRAKLIVTSWGIPMDNPAVLELVDSGFFNSFELQPDTETNELLPASLYVDITLQDFLNQEWMLPAGVNGELQLSVGDDPYDEETAAQSNIVSITGCETPGIIHGDIGEQGIVKAIWMGDGIQSTSVLVEDGSFTLSAGPGLVLVEVLQANGREFPGKKQMVVRIECAQTKDIGNVELTLSESIHKAYPFLGMTPEDLSEFILTFQADQEIQPTGVADCYLSDGILKVSLDPGIEILSLYRLEIPGVNQSGSYQGLFSWMDFYQGEANGQADVNLVIDQVDDLMGVKGSFQANYGGDMGDGQVNGEFACTYYPPMANNQQAEIDYASIKNDRKPLFSFVPQNMNASQNNEACRSAFVVYPMDEISPALGEYFAAQLHQSGLRLDVLSLGDTQALLGLQAERLLLGADEDEVQMVISQLAGALNTDFIFWVRMNQIGETYALSLSAIRTRDGRVINREMASGDNLEEVAFGSVYQNMIKKLPEADICGEIVPVDSTLNHGEKEDFTFLLTDLAGQEVSGARVETTTTKCGQMEPTNGTADRGEFETSFTANEETKPCDEQIVFSASMDGLGGQVKSKPEEGTATISVADQWLMEMNLLWGEGNDLVNINWSGSFHVNEDGRLVGSGNAILQGDLPNFPCVIIDADHGEIYTEPNPTTLRSDFPFYIYGDVVQQGEGTIFQIEPVAANVSLTYTFSNQRCAKGLSYDIFTGPFYSSISQQPTLTTGQHYFEISADEGSYSIPVSTFSHATLELSLRKSE